MPARRALTLSRTDTARAQPMRDQHRRDMLAEAERGEIRAVDLLWIPVEQIVQTPDTLNSRQVYADADIDELAASIKAHGITSPVLVRPIKRAEAKAFEIVIQGRPYVPSYVLIAGNRRYLAAKKIGLQELPALIRAVDSEKAFLLNLTENIQRRDLSNAERARAMQILANLADDRGERLSLSELQQRIQKSPATISTWIRIGRCAPLRDALEKDRIDIGRAMALAPLAREETMQSLGKLLREAPHIQRDELVARVSELAGEARVRRPRRAGRVVKRVATLNERRLMEAYRLLMNVDSIEDGPERDLLDQIQSRVTELLE
jgi:ParB family transcriptional regulator, chromosome partitioning protein